MGITSTTILTRQEAISKLLDDAEAKLIVELSRKSNTELDKMVNAINDDIYTNYLVKKEEPPMKYWVIEPLGAVFEAAVKEEIVDLLGCINLESLYESEGIEEADIEEISASDYLTSGYDAF